MVKLRDIIGYCNERTDLEGYVDFPGAENGLQFQNNGEVTKIGAAVDAGLEPIRIAKEKDIDFLIVHHGLFWRPFLPFTDHNYEKVKLLLENNMALYSNHLPLDGHAEIGNNAGIARELGLEVVGRFLEFEGKDIGIIAEAPESRETLKERLGKLFPRTLNAMEFGPEKPQKVGVCSGSGESVLADLKKHSIDTFITGELKQHNYNMAQELRLNVYACGHYATEIFGVQSLAKECSEKFNLPWEFISMDCLL